MFFLTSLQNSLRIALKSLVRFRVCITTAKNYTGVSIFHFIRNILLERLRQLTDLS